MRRYLLATLLAAVLGGCGRAPAAAPQPAASPEAPAAAAAPEEFAEVKAARANYEKAVAANPGNLVGLRRLAEQNYAVAQSRGDGENAKFFQG